MRAAELRHGGGAGLTRPGELEPWHVLHERNGSTRRLRATIRRCGATGFCRCHSNRDHRHKSHGGSMRPGRLTFENALALRPTSPT